MKLVERTIVIAAAPSDIYALLTDPELLVEWMAASAAVEPRPGGAITWTHHNGDTVRGEFVELVPNRRVVFTYGWERENIGIPPGSTTVEITLRPRADGSTELHLVHRGFEDPVADVHAGGWAHYLERLASCAAGIDPGPDPLATERVPPQTAPGGRGPG